MVDPQPLEHLIGNREDFFNALSTRVTGADYLMVRDHFDEHLGDPEQGIEGAYLCLATTLMGVLDDLNMAVKSMMTVFTGQDPPQGEEGPTKEES